MSYFLLIILFVILIVFIFFSYHIKYDHIVAFTGGLGSGKTLLSVKISLSILKKLRRKVRFKNFIIPIKILFLKNKIKKIDKPMLYSSIPIRISRKENSLKLTEKHLLLEERINEKSVVFIDEIGSFANQFEYNNINIKENFDEFVRLFRHYTKGGYIVCNDQCSENIVLQIRRRINTVYNLMRFKKFLFIFYCVKVRNISISEEIKTIEEKDTEDNMTTLFGIRPGKNTYDTFCYSERYNTVPSGLNTEYTVLKKNSLLKVSKLKTNKKTCDDDSALAKKKKNRFWNLIKLNK